MGENVVAECVAVVGNRERQRSAWTKEKLMEKRNLDTWGLGFETVTLNRRWQKILRHNSVWNYSLAGLGQGS